MRPLAIHSFDSISFHSIPSSIPFLHPFNEFHGSPCISFHDISFDPLIAVIHACHSFHSFRVILFPSLPSIPFLFVPHPRVALGPTRNPRWGQFLNSQGDLLGKSSFLRVSVLHPGNTPTWYWPYLGIFPDKTGSFPKGVFQIVIPKPSEVWLPGASCAKSNCNIPIFVLTRVNGRRF